MRSLREPRLENGMLMYDHLTDHYDLPDSFFFNVFVHQGREHINLYDESLMTWTLEKAGFTGMERVTEADLLAEFPGFPARHDEDHVLLMKARKPGTLT